MMSPSLINMSVLAATYIFYEYFMEKRGAQPVVAFVKALTVVTGAVLALVAALTGYGRFLFIAAFAVLMFRGRLGRLRGGGGQT